MIHSTISPSKLWHQLYLRENNNLITVTVLTSSVIMKEGKPVKGRTGLAREFKAKQFNINKIYVSKGTLMFSIAHFVR
jgi:hypothetical protein